MRAALMITCVADALHPQVGVAAARLLRRHGVRLRFPGAQTCCAQPAYNAGYHEEARDVAARFIDAFDGDDPIISVSGSCAAMARSVYPSLFEPGDPRRGLALRFAKRVVEFSEFFVERLGLEDIGARFEGRAVYHTSCHMRRLLGVVDAPRRLLCAVQGLELVEAGDDTECCGFGGAFAVKMPELSTAMADSKIDPLQEAGVEFLVSSDMACLMHMSGRAQRRGLGLRALHIAELLAEGVGLA